MMPFRTSGIKNGTSSCRLVTEARVTASSHDGKTTRRRKKLYTNRALKDITLKLLTMTYGDLMDLDIAVIDCMAYVKYMDGTSVPAEIAVSRGKLGSLTTGTMEYSALVDIGKSQLKAGFLSEAVTTCETVHGIDLLKQSASKVSLDEVVTQVNKSLSGVRYVVSRTVDLDRNYGCLFWLQENANVRLTDIDIIPIEDFIRLVLQRIFNYHTVEINLPTVTQITSLLCKTNKDYVSRYRCIFHATDDIAVDKWGCSRKNVLKYTSVIDEMLSQYEVEARNREGEKDGHLEETCALWDQAETLPYAQIEQGEAARRRREEEEARAKRDVKLAEEYKKHREEQLIKYEREVEDRMRVEAKREREREQEIRLKLERIQIEQERQCRVAEEEDEKRRAESIEYTLAMELEDGQSIEDYKAAQRVELRKYEQDRGEKGVWDDLFADMANSNQEEPRSSPPQHFSKQEIIPQQLHHVSKQQTIPEQDLWGAPPTKTSTTIAYSNGSVSPPNEFLFDSPTGYITLNSTPPPFIASPPLIPKHHTTAGVTPPLKSKLLPPSAFLRAPAVATNTQYNNKQPTTPGLPTPIVGRVPSTTPIFGDVPSATNPGHPMDTHYKTTDSLKISPGLEYNEEALPRRPRKVPKGRGKAALSSSGSTSSGESPPGGSLSPPGFGSPRFKVNVGCDGLVRYN